MKKKGPGRPKKVSTQMEEIQYPAKDCDLTILYFDELPLILIISGVTIR